MGNLMEITLFLIALATLVYLLFTLVEFGIGFNSIKNLSSQAILPTDSLPSVSIIFSALNEENSLANSIHGMLKLDYPNLEIIAVNDRSTDNTSLVLAEFKHQTNLKVKHINQLSKGWLGKNHALHVASQSATGEWLLFTDADVLMKSSSVAKAMSCALENKLDHLTIYEYHIKKSFWLKILLLASYIGYSMEMKPWRIRYAWSKKSLGHGAFNLVKKASYLKCGGHRSIAMECMDDLKLGTLLKNNGFKQDTVDGRDFIEREWYSSAKEMIKGFEKNGFAYFNYNFLLFFCNFIMGSIFYLWPCLAVFILKGPLQWLNLINIILTMCAAILVANHFRVQKRFAVFYPLGFTLLFYTVWNSVIATYKHKGIMWRGTYYSLQTLRNRK
jgi:cellulose synthase/poly-beta-1,6-N-acetylglucosamine synthase-like glycosyltransferase